MADSTSKASPEPEKPSIEKDAKLNGPQPKAKKLSPPNPMWKYLGFGENFRPRLPSRNWSIFLTITGSFATAVWYDKRETRRVQRKWSELVEHLAKEPLKFNELPRMLTVFLNAPPDDSLRITQEHFVKYVKPILVGSGLDWEFVQGRKEGDVRTRVAERIRNLRRSPEERVEAGQDTTEIVIAEARKAGGIKDFDGPKGDIVIGRHTWKEYVRGLHEGWLGPLTAPPTPVEEVPPPTELAPVTETAPETEIVPESISDATPAAAEEKKPEPGKPEDKKKIYVPPFISTSDYTSATFPAEIPSVFDPSAPIAMPHLLGFLNTPIRLKRFLTRRYLADSIGREVAAIILATYRPYTSTLPDSPSQFNSNSPSASEIPQVAEQQVALVEEEKDWPKKLWNPKVVEGQAPSERTWIDGMVLDARIAERMRRSELTAEDEERARGIKVSEEEVEGWIKGSVRSLYRSGKQAIGFGAKPVNGANPVDDQ